MPRDPRYNHARWHRLRARQLALEPFCRYCAQGVCNHRPLLKAPLVWHNPVTKQAQVLRCQRKANTADHIEPHRGDPFKFWCAPVTGLQSLCAECHSSVKQSQENRPEVGIDGWPINQS